MPTPHQIVLKARRRILLLRTATAALWVSSAILAALAVLLIAGTENLSWRWLSLAAALSLALAALRVARQFPAPYNVAQQLDRACGLQDALSTAWFLKQANIDSAAAQFQTGYAERAAQSVNLRSAVPANFRSPSITIAAILLAVIALAAIRYGHEDKLDLRPSMRSLWAATHQPETASSLEVEAIPKPALPPPKSQRTIEKATEQADNRVPLDTSNGKSPGDPQSASLPGKSTTTQRGIFDRMKDTLSDLLDHFKPDQNSPSEAQQNDSAQQHAQTGNPAGNEKRGHEEKPQQPAGNQEDLAQSGSGKAQNGEREGNQQSETKTRQGQGGMAQSEGKKPDANGNSAQSGAGSENGSQRIASAAELKAMGKMEQIMGQRAAQVSGDMTIVSSGDTQKLTTQFTGEAAHHRETDSPAANQPISPGDREFVRRYMDEMHRITEKQEK